MKRVIAMTCLRTAATQADECKGNPPNGGLRGQSRQDDPGRWSALRPQIRMWRAV